MIVLDGKYIKNELTYFESVLKINDSLRSGALVIILRLFKLLYFAQNQRTNRIDYLN